MTAAERQVGTGGRARAILETVAGVTRAVIAADSRATLLSGACSALVEPGAFAVAWVSADEDGDGRPERLALAGDDGGFTEAGPLPPSAMPAGGAAAWVSGDIAADARIDPWRDRLLAHGFRSGVAFPIPSASLPGAVLMAFATVAGPLDADAAAILGDLVAQIGFALDALAAREQLARSQERYRTIVDEAADGILVSDASGRYTEANPAICAMLGYTREEILARSTPELRATDDPLTPEEMDDLLAERPSGVLVERHYARKDGTSVPTETSFTVLPDGSLQRTIRDITSRKRAEEALRASEEQLRLVLDNTTDIIAVVGPDNRHRWISPSVTRLLGWQPEEWVGHRSLEFMHPDDLPAAADAIGRTLDLGEVSRFTTRVRTRDGGWLCLEVDTRPALDAGGNVVGRVSTARDVTDRRAAEEASLRLTTAIEQSADSVVVTDLRGNILYANPAFEATSGYTREEVIGQSLRILQSGLQDAEFYREMWATLTAGGTWRGILQNRRKDGTLFVEQAAISPVRGPDGSIVNYVAVKRDVTEARRAEAALRVSEERYRSLVEQLDGIVYIRDVERGEEYLSPQVETVLGYTVEEATSPGFWRTIVVDEDRARVLDAWDHDEELDTYSLEYRARRSDGEVVTLEERMSAVRGDDGKVARWYGLAFDVSRRKRLEEAVGRAERLDSMARVTAAAAHDFGNLLQGILFYQTMLADVIPEGHPAHGDVVAIGDAVRQGSALTRQMTAIGRTTPRTSAAVLDPSSLLGGMTSMLTAVAAPCALRMRAPATSLVLLPREVIEQGVLNLVINARDAMAGAAGMIEILLEREAVPPDSELGIPAGDYVVLRVRDNGPGMPPEIRDRAFEPFFTTKAHGTGIGLASVYGSMREFGGTAVIESVPGSGTTVSMLLPVAGD